MATYKIEELVVISKKDLSALTKKAGHLAAFDAISVIKPLSEIVDDAYESGMDRGLWEEGTIGKPSDENKFPDKETYLTTKEFTL